MKTVNSVLGAIISFFLLIGVTFKMMHWPGAGPLIVFSASLLSLYMIPVAIGNILQYKNNIFIGICNGIGAFSGMILSIGLLFTIMHWPGSSVMMLMGLMFSIITIFFFMILYITAKEPIQLSSGTFFSLICFGLLIYGVSVSRVSKNLLDNVVLNAVNIENNIRKLNHYNTSIVIQRSNNEINNVFKTTEDLNQYINKLRSKLYEVTDYIPQDQADTISLNQIMAKDNYDIPTYSLGLVDPENPKNGEFTATELKEKINRYNTVISEIFPETNRINTNDYSNYGGQNESWETSMFYHYTLAQVILTLNQIQLEANIICNNLITLKLLQTSNTQQSDTIN